MITFETDGAVLILSGNKDTSELKLTKCISSAVSFQFSMNYKIISTVEICISLTNYLRRYNNY
jgi:flagellar basal body rod protein FlgF